MYSAACLFLVNLLLPWLKGNFSLNLSWKPLGGLLHGKLGFLDLLAQRKAIALTIVDNTFLCTEFHDSLANLDYTEPPGSPDTFALMASVSSLKGDEEDEGDEADHRPPLIESIQEKGALIYTCLAVLYYSLSM